MRNVCVHRSADSRRLPLVVCLVLWLIGTVGAAPAFSLQPFVSTNLVGGTIELTLLDDGEPPANAFAFTWSRNGENLEDDERVTGTLTPVLRITPAQLEDGGVYSLVFTNQTDTNFTRHLVNATVYVVGEPEFVEEPFAETRGLDVTFRTAATGGLISYQWFWQGELLPGATNSSLRFTNAYANANAGYYTVRISNPANPEGVFASRSLLVTKPAPGGSYHGIFFSEAELRSESSGWLQFQLSSSRRTFSGSILRGKDRYSFSGKFPPDHYLEVEAASKTAGALSLRMQLWTINDAPQVTGEIQGNGWASTLRAHRLHYSSKLPTSLQGQYTLVLQNTNLTSEAPNGDGFASVSINRAGAVRAQGRAADGTAFSRATGLSRQGDWPLHLVTHSGRGRLLGWLRIARQTNRSIFGNWVGWIKDAGEDANYPEGFGLILQPTGSTYVPPTTGRIVNLTNGVAAVYGGDLFSDGDPFWSFIRVTLRPPLTFRPEKSPERLSLSASRKTGLVTGGFANMATGKTSKLYGAILQQQTEARGFFLSTSSAGAFWLAPQ